MHLPSNPYQPYQLLNIRPKWQKHWDTPFIKTEAEAIAAAKEARGRDLSKLLQQIRSLSDKDAPVFVVGDFNEPSHLDWTKRLPDPAAIPSKLCTPLLWHWQKQATLMPFEQSIQTRWTTPATRGRPS